MVNTDFKKCGTFMPMSSRKERKMSERDELKQIISNTIRGINYEVCDELADRILEKFERKKEPIAEMEKPMEKWCEHCNLEDKQWIYGENAWDNFNYCPTCGAKKPEDNTSPYKRSWKDFKKFLATRSINQRQFMDMVTEEDVDMMLKRRKPEQKERKELAELIREEYFKRGATAHTVAEASKEHILKIVEECGHEVLRPYKDKLINRIKDC